MEDGRGCLGGMGWGGVAPVEAVVGVVRQRERRHDQAARHGAHLLTQPLGVLADPLIPAGQTHRRHRYHRPQRLHSHRHIS